MTSISVIGTGAVGVAVCSSILHSELAQSLTLYDVSFEKAEGEALDFSHVNALFPGCTIAAKRMEELGASDVAILTAGVKSRPGETRLELLDRNLLVAETVAKLFEKNGFPKILIVVTNPVDVITEYFHRRWKNSGPIVFGTGTALDSLRLRYELSSHYGVSSLNTHAWVIGEHGDSSVSLLSSARIGCHSLHAYSDATGIALPNFSELQERVRAAAYKVIQRKGATSHAIGATTARIVRAVTRNEKIILPVSVSVERGVCASLPCVLGSNGPQTYITPTLTPNEHASYLKSLEILKSNCLKIPIDL